MSQPSESPAANTESAVSLPPEPQAQPSSPVDTEKHIPTSPHDEKRWSSETGPSLHHHASSPLPEAAPVVGAVGIVGEDEEKAEAAATAFKHHQSPPPARHENVTAHEEEEEEEKETHVVESNGILGTGTTTETEASPEESEGEGEDEIVFPGPTQLALLTFGLCVATFTVALDNTIIATAIPKITSVFDSLGDVGWYGSSYLLTTTALQPPFGRIYTYFNIKWTYMFSLVLFEFGSVICAAAKNSVMLIVGRAIAGAGASALFSGAMTILGFSVPLKKRPIYIASISSMFGIASVVGPLLGGAFTDRLTWRWCFWINLPFGGIALATVGFFFKNPKRKSSGLNTKQKILEIDLLGAAFLICAIVCLLLALQWGGSKYPWHDSKVWGCILGFGLLISIFIAQQFRRGDRATIPPRIFGQRTVLFCCLYTCFMSMALYTHIFYVPFYFQAVKGTTAEMSGIRTIPYLASIVVSSVIVGGVITVIGWYMPFMVFGAAVFTIGAGMIYTLQVPSTAAKWIGYQLLAGFGAGAGMQIPFIAVQVVLHAKDMPTGNAIAIFFNSLGGAISISVAQNIFANGLTSNLPKTAPGVDPKTVINAGATYLRKVVSKEQLPGVLLAYMDGLKEAFVISIACAGIATILACFVEWKSVKGKKIAPGAA